MEAAQFNFSLRALKIDGTRNILVLPSNVHSIAAVSCALAESELVTRFCTVLLERNVLAEETWGQRAHWFHLITRHFRARTEGLSVPASGSSLDSSRSPVAGAWLADSGDVMRTLLTSRRMTMCDGRRVCSSVANAIASFL